MVSKFSEMIIPKPIKEFSSNQISQKTSYRGCLAMQADNKMPISYNNQIGTAIIV